MEDLKVQEKILKLGKAIVKELGMEPGVDTLGRWMVHYLSEKMIEAEENPKASKECFETILKIWEHRWLLPRGNRPFENFEPILKVLKRINPDNERSFYSIHEEKELLKIDDKEISQCLKAIIGIDKASRVWIEYLLNKASKSASNELIKSCIENAKEIDNSHDLELISFLIDSHDSSSDQEKDRLKKRIEELEKYSKLNEMILESYKDDLESIN